MAPDWIRAAALEYGMGDIVVGAPLAFKESRALCRNYLRFVRQRDKIKTIDLKPAQALRACGFAGKVPTLKPSDRDRKVALSMWEFPVSIPGFMTMDISDPWEIVPLVGHFFIENPDLNLSLLDGRIWNRQSPEVMVNIPNDTLTQSVVLDVSQMSKRELKRALVGARLKFNAAKDSELFPVGQQLLSEWLRVGMVTSAASALIAVYPVDAVGWGALVPGNGIPWSFCISRKGISWQADHRVLDGIDTARFVKFLERRFSQ